MLFMIFYSMNFSDINVAVLNYRITKISRQGKTPDLSELTGTRVEWEKKFDFIRNNRLRPRAARPLSPITPNQYRNVQKILLQNQFCG